MKADVGYALRRLRRSPAFTLTAVLTLGLGLGAAATMWALLRTALLAPAPYPQAQQLVGVAFNFPGVGPSEEELGSAADFAQQHATSFRSTGVAEDATEDANISFHGSQIKPEQVKIRLVSSGYLQTLGIAPLLGRTFTAQEDHAGGAPVAVISYGFWQLALHGDRSAVGSVLYLNGEPRSIVGVMPRSFRDPSADAAAVFVPLMLSPSQPGYYGDNYVMVGRLKDGVTLSDARAEMQSLNPALYHEFPGMRGWMSRTHQLHRYAVWPIAAALTQNTQASLLTLASAVAAVLILACLNLAGLMSTRAAERRTEWSVRMALGARRLTLVRLVMLEGLVLAALAAAVGLAFTHVAEPVLLANSALDLPQLGRVQLWEQAGFLCTAALGSCLLFAVLPASLAIRGRFAMAGRSAVTAERSSTRFGNLLVAAQAGLAMVLLAGAALLLGVFVRLQSTSPGFSPQHLVAAQVVLHGDRYDKTADKARFVQRVVDSLQASPGVTSAAAIDGLPLEKGLNIGMGPADQPHPDGITELRPVTTGYTQTMGLHLLAGRWLSPSDNAGASHVALVSERAAQAWWPKQNAIGHQVEFEGDDKMPMLVVGVVSDTRTHSLAEPFNDVVYVPYTQLSDQLTHIVNQWVSTSFVVRVAADMPIGRTLDDAIASADADIPVATTMTLQSVVNENTALPRFFSLVATGFALFALLLSALGTFGLLSYQIAQRRREFGLRLALGATRARIVRGILLRGVSLTAFGASIGFLLSLRLPEILFNVLPAIVFSAGLDGDGNIAQVLHELLGAVHMEQLAAAVLLFAVAMLASLLPAWNAARTQPMEALRSE